MTDVMEDHVMATIKQLHFLKEDDLLGVIRNFCEADEQRGREIITELVQRGKIIDCTYWRHGKDNSVGSSLYFHYLCAPVIRP